MAEQHFPAPNPEQLVTTVNSVEDLRAMRMGRAEVVADRSARNFLRNIDRIEDPDASFSEVPDTALSYDIGILSPTDLLSIDAMGLSVTDMLARTGHDSGVGEELIESVTVEDETLNIKRYGEGVTVTFSVAGHDSDFSNPKKPTAITEKIKERFGQSPAHQAIHKLHESDALKSDTAITEAFDPYADPLATLSFMNDLGFVHGSSVARSMRNGITAQELLSNALEGETLYSVQREETEAGVTLTTGKEVVRTIQLDKQTGSMRLTIAKNPKAIYPEKANQSSAESLPFVDTRAAAEMYGLLDRSGLMFHPDYETEMTRTGDAKRFGSVYTQMSREVAKWVDRPDRMRLDSLFVPYDPSVRSAISSEAYEQSTAQAYSRTIGELEPAAQRDRLAEIQARINAMDLSEMSEPTKVLFGMVQDCLARPESEAQTDLNVTQSEVKIEGGACFDVAAYYIGSAGYRTGLTKINVEGVPMLEKTHGKHTFMLMQPTKFNGVDLPKGTLMQRGEDDGWAMLRLTPFCFDEPVDQLATGSEIAKAVQNEVKAIRRIGGVSLVNVVNFAA